MKKDRVVALCICVLLLGNFQLQQIAGIWHLTMPSSLPEAVWAIAMGKPFGLAVCSWTAGQSLQYSRPADLVATVMHSGWPQLAFVYDEVLLLKSHLNGLPAPIAGARKKGFIP